MNTIAERIREERERLGMSQEAFGLCAGVQKRAQINYENGSRVPDAEYLARVAAAGVDAQYVLTGKRLPREWASSYKAAAAATVATGGRELAESFVASHPEVLAQRERVLVDRYRALPGNERSAIDLIVKQLAGAAKDRA